MSWQEANLIEIKSLQEQKSYEGFFVGTRSEKIENRETSIHRFQNKDGLIEFWGSSIFDLKIRRVPVGSLCSISFEKTEQRGDKTIHLVKIMFDADQKIDPKILAQINREFPL